MLVAKKWVLNLKKILFYNEDLEFFLVLSFFNESPDDAKSP